MSYLVVQPARADRANYLKPSIPAIPMSGMKPTIPLDGTVRFGGISMGIKPVVPTIGMAHLGQVTRPRWARQAACPIGGMPRGLRTEACHGRLRGGIGG